MQAPLYGCILLALIPGLYLFELPRWNYDSVQSLIAAMEVTAAYLVTLFTSMTAYRLFFHRLRRFPGPFGARVSKIWHAWQVRSSENHLVMDKIYHQYGTFARTGEI